MNILDFQKMKRQGQKISMITCYDHWSASILNETKIDSILVGDSLGMVVYGHPSTLYTTPEMMIAHTQAVSRGAPDKFIITDMPFLSVRKGLLNAMNVVEQIVRAGAKAVKIEGLAGHEDIIKHIIESEVPVVGHLGLTPQSILRIGGHKVQGKGDESANHLLEQAMMFQELGCFCLVLECIPEQLATKITEQLTIPTIGIGAGVGVDGQVLVLQDLLGVNSNYFNPRFVRSYMNAHKDIMVAVDSFDSDIKMRAFPSQQETYQ